MRNQIRDYFINKSSPRNRIIFGVLLAVATVIFGILYSRFMKITGGDRILDMQLFYSQHEAFKNLSNYGNDGRRFYHYIQIVDMIIPFLYSYFFALLLSHLLKKAFSGNDGLLKLNLIPFLAAIADYTENVGVFIMLRTYPDVSEFLPTLTNIAGAVKIIINLSVLLLIIISAVKVLIDKLLEIRE